MGLGSRLGKTNHVNVKQVIGQLAEIVVGAEVVAKFSASDTSAQWLFSYTGSLLRVNKVDDGRAG